jgi:outer membrane murein-binding lipoprotein Lpp
MNKKIGFLILTVVLLLLAGCGPSVDQAKTQFCSDWQALGTALQNAKNLNENSTVEEAKAARDEIARAWDKAKSSSAQLQDVQLEATEAAFNAMTQVVDSIPEDATLGQAGAALQVSVTAFDAAYTATNTTVCVAR